MATADKLKKYVTDIANAIRAKEGSTEKINPQDFAQRIDNLQVGGGTDESGDSGWEYYKFDGVTFENTVKDMGYSDKEIKESMMEIFPFYMYCNGVVSNTIKPNAEVNLMYYMLDISESKVSYVNGFKQMISLDAIKGSFLDGVTSVAEAIEKYGELLPDLKPLHAYLTPCTKEEFEALITE